MAVLRHLWGKESTLLIFLLPAIVIPHLFELGYWRLDLETWLVGLITLSVGAFLAALGWLVPWLGRLLIAVAVYWFMDVYFDDSGLAAVFAGITIAWVLSTRFSGTVQQMMLAFSIVWLFANIAQPNLQIVETPLEFTEQAEKNTSLPPIIHIILDEQMSPSASPDSVPASSSANEILQDYFDRGILVYGRANSSTSWTRFSLSELVLLGSQFESFRSLIVDKDTSKFSIKSNPYFDALRELGYQLTIIQSSYLEFCDPTVRVDRLDCHTYRMNDNGHSITRLNARLVDRLMLAVTSLRMDYRNYGLTTRSLLAYQALRKFTNEVRRRVMLSMPPAMLSLLEDMRVIFKAPQPGHVYFAHLLIPHNPFVLTEQCGLAPWHDWSAANAFVKGWGWGDVEKTYWNQAACTHMVLMSLIDELQKTEQGRRTIVFIHGDHGSRFAIVRPPTLDREDSEDMVMTFLAVRIPGAAARITMEPVNLQKTFADVVNKLLSEFRSKTAAADDNGQ